MSFVIGVSNASNAIYDSIPQLNIPVKIEYIIPAHQVQHKLHPIKGIVQPLYLTPLYNLFHTNIFNLSIAPDKSIQNTIIILINNKFIIISYVFSL
jgi:hypothetical protein